MNKSETWRIFQGTGQPHDSIDHLPPPPPWRSFSNAGQLVDRNPPEADLLAKFEVEPQEVDLVNAALYLRRPLLVTGKPGTGKSTLAYAIAHELKLGKVLDWRITTRSTLKDGLYSYDAIARVQEAKSLADIGSYIKLGPLGTALLPTRQPRVLLIDEIDKSDIDLPNDLLHVFETGEFEIPELVRLPDDQPTVQVRPHDSRDKSDTVRIHHGRVGCQAFPIVVLTSNGERDFPPAFLRRCIRLDILDPDDKKLGRIVRAHLGDAGVAQADALIKAFVARRENADLATDQLLNAVYLAAYHDMTPGDLVDAVLRALR